MDNLISLRASSIEIKQSVKVSQSVRRIYTDGQRFVLKYHRPKRLATTANTVRHCQKYQHTIVINSLEYHARIGTPVPVVVCTRRMSGLQITHSALSSIMNIQSGSQMSLSYPITIMELEVCRQVGTNCGGLMNVAASPWLVWMTNVLIENGPLRLQST